jgi:hypothetical protein
MLIKVKFVLIAHFIMSKYIEIKTAVVCKGVDSILI